MQAWAILGGAYRVCGRPADAEAPYQEAFRLCESGSISELVQADTERRLSFLRACQGKPEEALELASGAVVVLSAIEDAPLGEALIAVGYFQASAFHRYGEAIAAFGEALAIAGAGKASPAEQRLHETASINLAMAISDGGSVSDQQTALSYIQKAYQAVKQVKGRTPVRYRLQWVEAIVWDRLGSHNKAARLYRRALEGFTILVMPWESALVSLDLAAMLHLCGEFDALEEIASTTYQQFAALSGADTQTLAALSLWLSAVRGQSWAEVDSNDPGRPLRQYSKLHTEARNSVIAGVLLAECCESKKQRRAKR